MIQKSVLVAHSQAQMFNLVNDVTHYPRFLPWCARAEVMEQDETQLIASLHIDYLKIKQHFTTRNANTPHDLIEISLVDGPFQHLAGTWRFMPLGELGCKIQFQLNYEFSSKLLEKVIGPVFSRIMTTLVDAFIHEADRVYGEH